VKAGTLRIAIEYAAGNATVRAMFKHPMETGRRRDEYGALVPEFYLAEVICEYRGQVVLQADWSTGVAKNPALTLQLHGVHRGDKLRFRWRDNRGDEESTEVVIR
jgi:sulfur-oxidizing protein SoxZ